MQQKVDIMHSIRIKTSYMKFGLADFRNEFWEIDYEE